MAGLYLHVPFCRSKCVYCGFYSVANTDGKARYIRALEQEIVTQGDYLRGEPVRTLYFGGGTPSLLSPDELEHILALLQPLLGHTVEEFTMEANPEQLTSDYCRALRALGVNRLSIGVQSFDDAVLRFMGRRHTAKQAAEAVHNAAAAGFDNLSIDLIYGVAERDNDLWRKDLETAFALPVCHLSCYALTPEENSILYKQIQLQRHAPVDDGLAAEQYRILLEALPHSALRQYEVSNFAVPGSESQHNSAYWAHVPYLGLGPSAHSFDGESRQWNPTNLARYCDNMETGVAFEERETLTGDDLYNETLMLGLRTRAGVDLDAIRAQYGDARAESLIRHFREHVAPEHYQINESRLLLTETGLWFADGIAESAFII